MDPKSEREEMCAARKSISTADLPPRVRKGVGVGEVARAFLVRVTELCGAAFGGRIYSKEWVLVRSTGHVAPREGGGVREAPLRRHI